MRRVLMSVCCAGLLCSAARADEAIATDRPDFVESSDVVGKGRFQLETSVAGERSTIDGVKLRGLSTPTLLRFGLSENVELRLETDGRLRVRAGGLTESGYSDVSVGAKWHVQEGDEASGKPGVAWLFHADLATGSGPFRGQGTRPSVRLAAEWELPDGYNIGVMPGVYRDRNEDGRSFTGAILAVTFGKSFTDKLHGFVELAGQQLASKKNGGSLVTFDTGLSYLISNDWQIDMAVSRGLNKQSPDFQWTTGISTRF